MFSLRSSLRRSIASTLCVLSLGVATAVQSNAVTLTFTGTGTNTYSGNNNVLSSSVVFDYNGSNLLTVTLKNTTPGGAIVPSDVLTSVLWIDNNSGVTITPNTAALAPGSVLLNAPGSYNIGAEWQYSGTISGPNGTNSGISTSGYGLFGAGNFFTPGNPTDGMNYGIISGVNAGANPAINSGTFAMDTMVFTLNVSGGFNINNITGVQFQYGTSLSEPRIPGTPGTSTVIPEPGVVALLVSMGSGSVALGFRRRRYFVMK